MCQARLAGLGGRQTERRTRLLDEIGSVGVNAIARVDLRVDLGSGLRRKVRRVRILWRSKQESHHNHIASYSCSCHCARPKYAACVLTEGTNPSQFTCARRCGSGRPLAISGRPECTSYILLYSNSSRSTVLLALYNLYACSSACARVHVS